LQTKCVKTIKFIFLTLGLSILASVVWSYEENLEPIKTNHSEWKQYIPTIRSYDPKIDGIKDKLDYIFSQHRTRKYSIKESDLSKIPYNKSIALITIYDTKKPLSVIEIKSYKSYRLDWLNEELIHIQTWPGRCVQLDEIINIKTKASIYSSNLYHCGARK